MTLIELALGDHVLDRGEPWLGRRDLDHQVRTLDDLVQVHRFAERRKRVVGEAGVDLERDVAVALAAAVPHRAKQVAGVFDVLLGERPEDVLDRELGVELAQLLVVGVAGGHRLLEDRRVRGGADD